MLAYPGIICRNRDCVPNCFSETVIVSCLLVAVINQTLSYYICTVYIFLIVIYIVYFLFIIFCIHSRHNTLQMFLYITIIISIYKTVQIFLKAIFVTRFIKLEKYQNIQLEKKTVRHDIKLLRESYLYKPRLLQSNSNLTRLEKTSRRWNYFFRHLSMRSIYLRP